MPTDTILNKLFVYVPNQHVSDFKESHTGINITSSDEFYKKICLLGNTGTFTAHGEVFGLASESAINIINTLLGTTLTGTNASTLNASTVIEFIQKVYELANANKTAIGDDSTSGTVKKRIKDLETTVDTATTGLTARVTTLIGEDTSKSVRTIAGEEVAKIVAGADSSYDTLKEIADWILSDTTGAAKMQSDISDLKEKVGDYSVSTQITNSINALDVESSTKSASGTPAHAGTYVVSGVTLGETDGKITGFAVTSTEVEVAGAAAAVKSELTGSVNDVVTTYTIHGAFNYAKDLVDNKNVTAESSYTSLITTTYSGNKVTIGVTEALKSALDKANSAIQSIQYTTTNNAYISVSGAIDRVNVGDVTLSVTPNMGILSISNKEFAYTNGIAYTQNIADILNSIDLWEEYTAPSNS